MNSKRSLCHFLCDILPFMVWLTCQHNIAYALGKYFYFASALRDRVLSSLHSGGPWDSIVKRGSMLTPLGLVEISRVSSTWRDRWVQLDPWSPFGHPWNPFWCSFNTLRPYAPNLLILGLNLATLGVDVGVFSRVCCQTMDSFAIFPESCE